MGELAGRQDFTCNLCQEVVTVIGDWEWIDPELYWCPNCRNPTGRTEQLELGNERVDLISYRPDMAAIPF